MNVLFYKRKFLHLTIVYFILIDLLWNLNDMNKIIGLFIKHKSGITAKTTSHYVTLELKTKDLKQL